LPPLVLALVLGVLSAVAVACGDEGDDRRLIAPSRAADIREELDTIASRVERGNCDDLQPAFTRLERAVDELPQATDRRLRRRLAEGVQNLRQIAPDECRDNRPETTETTETTETVPETTTTPPQTETVPPPETTPPPPPETTPPPPPETVTPPPPETGTPPIDPDGTGGDEAPGAGFVPPGQAKKDGRG
jgi:outer membrane biosynthesis protein TonB